eukprot:2772842-Prymnesium_polylepis.1
MVLEGEPITPCAHLDSACTHLGSVCSECDSECALRMEGGGVKPKYCCSKPLVSHRKRRALKVSTHARTLGSRNTLRLSVCAHALCEQENVGRWSPSSRFSTRPVCLIDLTPSMCSERYRMCHR